MGKNVFTSGDATVQDVVFHPGNPELVLAGLSGSVPAARIIQKTTDGGQTWTTVYEGIATYAFAHSARDARIIYASGRNAEGTLFFVVTTDFGETWKTIEMEKK